VNCHFEHTEEGGLTVNAIRDIAPGEQVFISYDNRPDDQLLLDYGFVLEPGENAKTFLLFTFKEVAAFAVLVLLLDETLVQTAMTDFLSTNSNDSEVFPGFKVYEGVVGYDLINFVESLIQRKIDTVEMPFDDRDAYRQSTTKKFIYSLMDQRLLELDNLDALDDQDERTKNNYQRGLYRKLRDIHRHIAESILSLYFE